MNNMRKVFKRAEDGMQMQDPGMQQAAPSPNDQAGEMMNQVIQVVQQMISQQEDPTAIVKALTEQFQLPPQAIMQILTQLGMPEDIVADALSSINGNVSGAETPSPEEMEGAPVGDASTPEVPRDAMMDETSMKFGGPVKKDFQQLSRDMIKSYRKGGEAGELDPTSTENYIQNLKGALSNHLAKSNAIATVKRRSQDNMALFDTLPGAALGTEIGRFPKAVNGDEYTEEEKAQRKAEAEKEQAASQVEQDQLQTKYKDYETKSWEDLNKDYNSGKITAGEFGQISGLYNIKNPATKSVTAEEKKVDPNKFYTFDPKTNTYVEIPKVSIDGIIDEPRPKTTTDNQTHYYPGQYADKSLSGKTSNMEQFLTTPLAQMINPFQGAIGPKTATGNVQVKGLGNFAGMSQEEIANAVKNGNFNISSVEDVRRKGILGREKRKDTDWLGRSNVIGKRVYFNPTTGKTETQNTNEPLSSTPASPGRSGFNADANGNNIPDYLEAQSTSTTATTPTVQTQTPTMGPENSVATTSGNTNTPAANTVGYTGTPPTPTAEEIQAGLTSDDKWTQQATQGYLKSLETENPTLYNAIMATTKQQGTTPTGNTAAPQTTQQNTANQSTEDMVGYTDQALKNLGYTQEQFDKDWNVRNKVYAEEDRLNAADVGDVEENFRLNVLETLGLTEDQYSSNFNIQSQVTAAMDDLEAMLNERGITIQQYNQNPNILNEIAPVANNPLPTQKVGGIVWDFKKMKFVNEPHLDFYQFAKNGITIRPEYQREINFGAMADGVYGVADSLNQKLGAFRSHTSRADATAQRSTDNMFTAVPPSSGVRGFYDENGRQTFDSIGAGARAGTQDQSVFGEFTNKNYYQDLLSNNVNYKNGGAFFKALNGMDVGQEIELTPEEEDLILKAGYQIKKLQ